MNARHIIKLIYFLKKKRDFTFLNVAGILFVAISFIALFGARYSLEIKLKNNETAQTTSAYRDLTCIKPFTSLVGFNWKFSRETKRKEVKTEGFVFSLFHL